MYFDIEHMDCCDEYIRFKNPELNDYIENKKFEILIRFKIDTDDYRVLLVLNNEVSPDLNNLRRLSGLIGIYSVAGRRLSSVFECDITFDNPEDELMFKLIY